MSSAVTDPAAGQADLPHRPPIRIWAAAGVLLGAAGFTAALTCMYRGMRSVMIEAGGYCAQGGPYEIANECTNAQVTLLMVGIFAMLIFGALFAGATTAIGNSGMGAMFLMWAALFGALGWNFIELGINPPDDSGLAWGWLISGVVFILMALGGLVPALQMVFEWRQRGGEEETLFEAPIVRANVNVQQPTPPPQTAPTGPSTGAPVPKRLNIPAPGDTPDFGPEPHERDWSTETEIPESPSTKRRRRRRD